MQTPREENAHCKGNADEIVDDSPEEIETDATEGGAGEVEGCGDVGEGVVLTHEDNVCCFHCDVCAGTQGNAERSGRQSRGVVDSVANLMLIISTRDVYHCDNVTLLLHLFYEFLFALRRDPSPDGSFINSNILCNTDCSTHLIASNLQSTQSQRDDIPLQHSFPFVSTRQESSLRPV